MVEIFKLTGKRIVAFGIVLILVGAFLLGYFHMLFNLIMYGKWPEPEETAIGLGNVLILVGTWVIKIRNTVYKGVK